MYNKTFFVPGCVVFLLIFLPAATVQAQWYQFDAEAMTTRLVVELWSDDEAQARRLAQQVFQEFDRIEQKMSRYLPDSELSRINREAASKRVTTDAELFALLKTAQQVSVMTEGAFDITFASLGRLYDYRESKQPTADQLEALAGISYRDVRLNIDDLSVAFERAGVVLDLGGIAKGYAVDQGVAILTRAGVKHAQVSAGGDLRIIGDKRGKPWIVAVKDPRADARHAVVLPLSDTAMSTSGDYERYFIDAQGKRIHHILRPATGRPARGVQSVSILGPDATTTDALSTAVFVQGVTPGLELINRLSGIDAIIVDDQRKLHYSNDLEAPKKPAMTE